MESNKMRRRPLNSCFGSKKKEKHGEHTQIVSEEDHC